MNEKEELIEKYAEWIAFVKSLEAQDEQIWNQPMAEGKWTVRDVVSHIMKWDEYFLEGAILKISCGEELTVKHLNYDTFNEQSKEYGRTCSIQGIAEEAKTVRQRLVGLIISMSEEQYTTEYVDADGHAFQVAMFMQDFIWHDQHHMKQIENIRGNSVSKA